MLLFDTFFEKDQHFNAVDFDIYFFDKEGSRNKLILGLANFLLRKPHRNNHRITNILLSLGSIGLVKVEI